MILYSISTLRTEELKHEWTPLLEMSSFANIVDLNEETIAIVLVSQTFTCVYVCVYACVHACMHVCLYVPICVCM